jgi:hypothetical protein
MKKEMLMLLAIVANCLEESTDTISNLSKNLDVLNKDNSGVVNVSLTISGLRFKFVKVLGEWGVMCANGSWEPFRIIPMAHIEDMANAVNKLVNGKTE